MASPQFIESLTRLINEEMNQQMHQLKEENKQLKVELNTMKFELNSVVKLYSKVKSEYERLVKTTQSTNTTITTDKINKPLQISKLKNIGLPNLTKSFKEIASYENNEDDRLKNVRQFQSLYESNATVLPPPKKKQKSNEETPRSDDEFRLLPTQYSDDEEDPVLKSSPVKISPYKPHDNGFVSPKKPTRTLPNESNRDIHLMSTQYTASSSVPNSQTEIPSSSPQKVEEIVEDSQQQEEEITLSAKVVDDELTKFIAEFKPKTKLKRIQCVINFYDKKYQTEETFMINLKINPIHEQGWKLSDFKPNPIWIKKRNVSYVKTPGGKTFERRIGITKSEENKIRKFYQVVNRQGEDNDAYEGITSEEEDDGNDDDEYEDQISQIFDKLASPPGFMQSEFPDSEERIRRREIINARQIRRLKRRIKACIQVNKFKEQMGEFVFSLEILNKYVKANRFTL
ncbi:hypothetical protein DFJ63DRAFT_312975 [Scheffersomyces coipomensis]|uniref:uncharacterized protein n=1 Tax=Scheffersomyces coipomensis TaxID=1788519 RepID=UPI00315D344B